MTPEQFAEIKAWLAWDGRASSGVKLEAIVEDLVAEVERLNDEVQWWKDRDECERANWQAEVARLRAQIASIKALHRPHQPLTYGLDLRPEDGHCEADGSTWPCQTARALASGEQVQS